MGRAGTRRDEANGGARRIVVATFGTLGDLYPALALALGLRARGHCVTVATSDFHREQVEGFGLAWASVRPQLPDWRSHPDAMARLMDPRRGTERVVRELVLPHLGEQYDDLLRVAAGADMVVSSLLVFSARLVAERLAIPWVSMTFQPSAFLSVFDPPVLGQVPGLGLVRMVGPHGARAVLRAARKVTNGWTEPWHDLRREIGLPPMAINPFWEGQHSPLLTLALFSPLLGRPQIDWPPSTVVTGFPFDDRIAWSPMSDDLEAFLVAGEPPIAFTLGSSAAMSAGDFYEESVEAARRLGRRAVLLVGPDPRNRVRELSSDGFSAVYAPHGQLFPRCAAVVHQGGIGTTGQAMRSGRPMLVVPFAHDQPDNANRVRRLGVAKVIPGRRYSAGRAERALADLLADPAVAERAVAVGAAVRTERGVERAVEAVEAAACGR